MRSKFILAIGALCAAANLSVVSAEDDPLTPAASAISNRVARVSFDSFANIHYSDLEPLDGWLTTRTVVEEGLRGWFPGLEVRQSVMDGTPPDLEKFLSGLPGGNESEVAVVYLASYQSAAGAWRFVNREQCLWSEALRRATIKPHPFRVVILDSCYAAVAERTPEWSGRLATVTLWAGSERELTYELDLSTRVPVDFRRRYPLAWEWTRKHLAADWNRKISFLGLMWLEAWVETASPPKALGDWRLLFDHCQSLAEEFRKKCNRRWVSSVHGSGIDGAVK